MFTQEAQTSGKTKLLLTAATAPDGRMSALDLPALNRYFQKFHSFLESILAIL